MQKLRLFNSLTRKKEEFKPLDPGHVRVYACGPTVYNYAHIGNARMAVVFDLLANVLRTQYPKVTYVSNITDVDDKIIAASRETGEGIDVITRKFEAIYNEDMAALGVRQPDVQPRATEHIGEMIALIQKLMDAGHAYEKEKHVMFNVPSFPAYGGLSGRSRDEQIAGARVEVAPYKKDPADFILWKPSNADEPGWDSPWGRGRPGWHIECSAMAEKHLGLPFDIHGGGADLKFPHHENEIAQSCCAHGEMEDLSAFAKYWVHNGFVTVDDEKMSKSIGNIRLVHDLISQYPGPVLRLALLSAQYSQPLDWTRQKLEEAQKLYDRILRARELLNEVDQNQQRVIRNDHDILHALYDDLNSPLAIARLNAILTSIFSKSEIKDDVRPSLKYSLNKALEVLGVEISDQQQKNSPELEKLLIERTEAKKAKNFKRADEIRDEVKALGFTIEDTAEGPKARKIS